MIKEFEDSFQNERQEKWKFWAIISISMKDPLSSTTPSRILSDKLLEFKLRLEPMVQPQEPLLKNWGITPQI